jgi:hypothetical protein
MCSFSSWIYGVIRHAPTTSPIYSAQRLAGYKAVQGFSTAVQAFVVASITLDKCLEADCRHLSAKRRVESRTCPMCSGAARS